MKVERFVAFSCTHCPLEDPEAVNWLRREIEEIKPTLIVHLGDGHEADSASRWPSEASWSLVDEFEAHNRFLAGIRESAPDARKIFLPGNHDDNLLALNRIDKKLRGLCDYRKQPVHEPELKHWYQPAQYVFDAKKGVFRVGQVTFGHGYKSDALADETHSILLGVPFGLYVGGHLHRPQAVTQASKSRAVLLPYWYANAGTLRDMWDVDYMSRKDRSRWGQALVTGEINVTGRVSLAREWDAETRIFRMYGDR